MLQELSTSYFSLKQEACSRVAIVIGETQPDAPFKPAKLIPALQNLVQQPDIPVRVRLVRLRIIEALAVFDKTSKRGSASTSPPSPVSSQLASFASFALELLDDTLSASFEDTSVVQDVLCSLHNLETVLPGFFTGQIMHQLLKLATKITQDPQMSVETRARSLELLHTLLRHVSMSMSAGVSSLHGPIVRMTVRLSAELQGLDVESFLSETVDNGAPIYAEHVPHAVMCLDVLEGNDPDQLRKLITENVLLVLDNEQWEFRAVRRSDTALVSS
jgi:hypothetical protein